MCSCGWLTMLKLRCHRTGGNRLESCRGSVRSEASVIKSVISLRWNRHSIVHMSLKPARDELCNFQTILFQHHHMTGAVYVVVFEAHVFVGDAGLGKVLRCAVVPRSVKRCFAADD